MVTIDPRASAYERFFVRTVNLSLGLWALFLSLGFVLLVAGLVVMILEFAGLGNAIVGFFMALSGLLFVLYANLLRGGREYARRYDRPGGRPL